MLQDKIQLVVFLAGILSKASCDFYRIVLIEEQKTWAEAQSYCREKHIDLATVQSDEDRAKLKEAANTVNFQSDAWTGFYRVSWRWSYQNTPVSYTNWGYNEPDVSSNNESCAVVKRSGRWADTNCDELKHFFCRTDKTTLKDRFEYREKELLNWYDAQTYCREHKIDLANIIDDDENQVLVDKLDEKQDYEAWIGLYKSLWQWQWSDNTSVLSSVKWEPGQPNNAKGTEECVRVSTDGLMADDTCSTPLPFYCHENSKIQRVRLALKSDRHLDESTVKEAIEKKMKQIFLGQKIRYTITWSIQPDGKIFQLQKTRENRKEMPTACEEMDFPSEVLDSDE